MQYPLKGITYIVLLKIFTIGNATMRYERKSVGLWPAIWYLLSKILFVCLFLNDPSERNSLYPFGHWAGTKRMPENIYALCSERSVDFERDWRYPNCLRLVLGQSRALTSPKLCVICSRNIILWQNFRVALRQNPEECRKIFMHCVRRGQWTSNETIVH